MHIETVMVARPGSNLFYYVWKLLRLRWIIFYNGFLRAKTGRKIIMVLLGLFLLGVVATVFLLSWVLLRFLRSPTLLQYGGDIQMVLSNVPVMILTAAFLGILLTSFGVLLQALYLAGDMDFLLSAPIPIRAVFISKMLQAILPNFSLISLFGLPVLFGMGIAGGYNILYFPLVIIVLAFMALAAAGLSSLLVMGIARIFPARRVAEVLAFIGAIISILCSQSGQLSNQIDWTRYSNTNLTSSLNTLSKVNTPWSPLAWGGRALVDIGEGRWGSGLLFLILSLGITGGLFIVSLNTAERLYYSGWAGMQVSPRRKKVAPAARPQANENRGRINPVSTLLRRIMPAPIRGVIWKDLLVVRRDLRNMSQVVTPLIFGLIYGIMLLRNGGNAPAGRGEAPEIFTFALKQATIYGSVALSLFVSWSLLSRLALTAFSQEGKSYWLIKSAPVSSGKLLISKFLVAFIPSLALGWLFLAAISLVQRASPAIFLFGLCTVALSIAGIDGVNLAFGVTGARLDWEDPRQMTSGSQSCLSSLLSFGYLVLTLLLFFGPPIGLSLLTGLSVVNLPVWVGQVFGLALGGVVSLVGAVLPLMMVRDRVARIGE